jgi:hypothetical protein
MEYRDLLSFRTQFEQQSVERIEQKAQELELTISGLKRQLFGRMMSRAQFYSLYEEQMLQLDQIHRVLRLHGRFTT